MTTPNFSRKLVKSVRRPFEKTAFRMSMSQQSVIYRTGDKARESPEEKAKV
jgi:hypothetical protein